MKEKYLQLVSLDWESFAVGGISADEYEDIDVSQNLEVLEEAFDYLDCYQFTFTDCGAYDKSCIADSLFMQMKRIFDYYHAMDQEFAIKHEGSFDSQCYTEVQVFTGGEEGYSIRVLFDDIYATESLSPSRDFVFDMINWNDFVAEYSRYHTDFLLDFSDGAPTDALMTVQTPADLLLALQALIRSSRSFALKIF